MQREIMFIGGFSDKVSFFREKRSGQGLPGRFRKRHPVVQSESGAKSCLWSQTYFHMFWHSTGVMEKYFPSGVGKHL